MTTKHTGQDSFTGRRSCRDGGKFSLLIALLFWGTAFPCHAFDVIFHSTATVSGPSVTLADIADLNNNSELANALSKQTVAASPDAGQKNVLDTNGIIHKLTRTITTPTEIKWSGAGTVTVERQGVTVTPHNIQEAIETYIAKHAKSFPGAKYTFTPKDPPLPFLVPVGDLQWEVIPSTPGIIGSNRFSLIGRIDNQVVKNFSVLGTLEVLAPVAVAVSNLRRDDIIGETQIQIEPQDISALKDPCLQLNQVIGKKLLRNIKAGSVIDLSSIDFPPMVKKGAFVKILCQKNGIELTATGIAKTDGKQDQIIKVKNSSSDKEIFGRVTAPGLVEVQI
jgi:flagellar basal body P-ring formation protein FlgA